jgi:hypothetical protein
MRPPASANSRTRFAAWCLPSSLSRGISAITADGIAENARLPSRASDSTEDSTSRSLLGRSPATFAQVAGDLIPAARIVLRAMPERQPDRYPETHPEGIAHRRHASGFASDLTVEPSRVHETSYAVSSCGCRSLQQPKGS